MAPPITVIIPCYNPSPSIFGEALQSVLRSTLQDFEVLVVNDGSTDASFFATAAEAAAADPRVQVLHHPQNRGLSAARNTGVAACQTPYFLQLDADDLIEPTFIEKCLWALESHPQWQFCNSWSVGFGAKSFLWERGFERGTDFLAENQVTPTAVIRRAADRAIGGHDESIRGGLEDWDYWLKMAAHGFWGGTIPEPLTRYRHHARPTYWPNRDDPARRAEFRRALRRRYPLLWRRGGFPVPRPGAAGRVSDEAPFAGSAEGRPGRLSVLLLVPWFSLGGADRFNLTLVEQLVKRGAAVTLCATTDGPHPWLGAFTGYTTDYFILPNFLAAEDYPRFLRDLIRSRRADVVLISHSMLGYSLLPYLRTGCPHTTFVDYNHIATEWLEGGFVRMGRIAQKWLDLNIAASQQVKAWMTERGANPARIEVCYTNIDTAEWDPARHDRLAVRQDWGVPENAPVIIVSARLSPQKRPRVLVEILRALRAVAPGFWCLIAGDGPQRAWLAAAIARYGLHERVRLLGAVAPHHMSALMAASDVLLLPSQAEGISLAIFEAMAMGIVPVVADVGGQRELVTPDTGFLIPHGPDEIGAYVAALRRLIEAPDLRVRMGQAARERICAHFTIEQMADRMQALFEAAQGRSRAEPRPTLGTSEAQALAERVVDDLRFERLQEGLRAEHPLVVAAPERGPIRHWRRLIYRLKKRIFRPVYYWALRSGFEWVEPLANRAYRLLGWMLR